MLNQSPSPAVRSLFPALIPDPYICRCLLFKNGTTLAQDAAKMKGVWRRHVYSHRNGHRFLSPSRSPQKEWMESLRGRRMRTHRHPPPAVTGDKPTGYRLKVPQKTLRRDVGCDQRQFPRQTQTASKPINSNKKAATAYASRDWGTRVLVGSAPGAETQAIVIWVLSAQSCSSPGTTSFQRPSMSHSAVPVRRV